MRKLNYCNLSTTALIALMTVLPSLMALQPVSMAYGQELPVPREETVIVEIQADLYITIFDSFNHLIPGGCAWGSGWQQITLEYDWYYNYVTGEIIYWRITGWDYDEDFTTYTMYVRQGVTWNDGEPYTANDIAFTLNLMKSNTGLSGHGHTDEWIESIEAPDDYTVVIHLKKPNPRFHYAFTMWGNLPCMVAKHVWENEDATTFKNNPPVDTGPYKLYQVLPDLKLHIWERRDDYWGKDLGVFPSPKYVVFRGIPYPSLDLDLADFVRGDVDSVLAHFFTWDAIKTAQALTPNVTICPFLDPCIVGVRCINCERYPFDITDFRWAISYCMDREKISNLWPLYKETWPAVVPWSAWKSMDIYRFPSVLEEYKLEYNPAKAIEILDNLGFVDKNGDGWRDKPDGSPLTIDIQGPPSDVAEALPGLVLVDELKAIGLDATYSHKGTAWEDFIKLGHYDIFVHTICPGAWVTNDLLYSLDMFHSKNYKPEGEMAPNSGWSSCRYKNSELDAIIDEVATLSPDDPRVMVLYEQGLEILMRDLPTIPAVEKIYVPTFSTRYWTGWPSEDNQYFWSPNWTPSFFFVLARIQPIEAPAPVIVEYVGTWFTGEVTAFTGVDERSYGPFVESEYAVIPKEDAERLIDEGLASYALPGISEITAALESIGSGVSEVKTTVEESVSQIAESVAAVSGQMSMLTAAAVIEGIAIVVLAVALMMRGR